jgi:hypothetical protein
MALAVLTGVWDVPVSGSRAVGWVIGTLFCLVGLAIMFAAVWGSYAREMVHEELGGLLFRMSFLGRRHRRRFVPKREIEEIALRETTSRPRHRRAKGSRGRAGRTHEEVVVRSDTGVVRIGSDLTAEEQRWLQQAMRYLAVR